GTIAWIDAGGALALGPQSAGAAPGPVCYGLGGTEPTVTDANVVLGRIDASRFLGGSMPLDAAGAARAVDERLTARLGLSRAGAAAGVVRLADVKMALAVRGNHDRARARPARLHARRLWWGRAAARRGDRARARHSARGDPTVAVDLFGVGYARDRPAP